MKKLFLKPGFEVVFALSIIVILGLPPVLLAQNHQDLEIKIENGDTSVNGKNIKDLSEKDRMFALRDIKNLGRHLNTGADSVKTDSFKHKFYFTERVNIRPDSIRRFVPMENGQGSMFRKRPAFTDRKFGVPVAAMVNRKNSQSFDYLNIDNEGISTHIRFRISEISNEDLKKMPHVEGGKFEIENLTIVPEFNTGATLLLFDLPAKNAAEVKLIKSDGKIIWSEKTEGGRFSKTFGLGLNGIYYLQIKQGNFIAIKRIVKEE